MAAKIDLLIIDPQESFCSPTGELPVTGADQDMVRVGNFIRKNKAKINNLHITLDSHQDVHIAHPIFWKNGSTGKHPDPFTKITANDVNSGVWTTTKSSLTKYGIKYVEALDEGGRYPLVIWPPHCLIGTKGQTIFAPIQEAVREYCAQFATVDYVTKGSNLYTEHYSAIKAEVDPVALLAAINPKGNFETDPSVLLNTRFLTTVDLADLVLVCGEAGDYCLANTLRDAVKGFQNPDVFMKKLVLLTDGTSPIDKGGYNQFLSEFSGMQTATTDSFMF